MYLNHSFTNRYLYFTQSSRNRRFLYFLCIFNSDFWHKSLTITGTYQNNQIHGKLHIINFLSFITNFDSRHIICLPTIWAGIFYSFYVIVLRYKLTVDACFEMLFGIDDIVVCGNICRRGFSRRRFQFFFHKMRLNCNNSSPDDIKSLAIKNYETKNHNSL